MHKFSQRITFAALLTLISLSSSPTSHAWLVPNNISLETNLWGGPADLMINQDQRPGDIGLFAIGIDETTPGTYHFIPYGIFERYSLHAAVLGLEFTPAYVINDSRLLSNDGPVSFETSLAIGQRLLLAYWDDGPVGGGSGPSNGDAFGWFSLTRTSSGLELTDSATAFGAGIFVGTYVEVVPEPAAGQLLLLGLLALCVTRLHQSQSKSYSPTTPPAASP